MKKSFTAILIIVVLFGALVGCFAGNGRFAYAADTSNYYDFQVDGVTYRLYTLTHDETPIGVYLYEDRLFGSSEIPITAEIYSTPNLVIDFRIGSSNLDEAQASARNKIVVLFSDIIRLFSKVNSLVSTAYDGSEGVGGKTSEVGLYNKASKGARLKISFETYEMMQIAQEMYEVTDGAFNPAVYRLVDLWGFSSRIYSNGNFGLTYDREVTADEFFGKKGYPLPDTKYVDAFSDGAFTDFSKEAVTLEEVDGEYFVTKNVAAAVVDGESFEQWIDLGGIAKGYAVDKARAMVEGLGIDRFYIDAGSSSKALGWEYDGGKTTLGIQDSYSYLFELLSVDVGKSSVSTSGQYIRKYTVDGVEYAHILDGVTGAPAQTGIRSVTVIVPEEMGEFWAAKGDCLTTALTVMGRNKIVDFTNSYLEKNGIKIIVQYETLEGKRQILSNYSQDDVTFGRDGSEFVWALRSDDSGNFYYDANAKFINPQDNYTALLITLGVLLGVGAVVLIVYHFVRGKKRVYTNVLHAKKDKPFKVLDVMLYLGVALVILVLLFVFVVDVDNSQLQLVNVIDMETGETLFAYNLTRDEYTINVDNLNGWKIEVSENDGELRVTFSCEIRGEERMNIVQINRYHPSVVMVDSVCGRSQDCVRRFSAITRSGGAIACTPNRLKIETK